MRRRDVSARFSFTAREAESVLHMRFVGYLDYDAVCEAQDALQEPLAGKRTVVLDLSRVSFLDSYGLRLLVHTKRNVESRGGRLLISQLSPAVERILVLAHLTAYFDNGGPDVR